MKSLIERGECPMRHENGNCTVAGGFCMAVNDPICEALHNAFYCGEYSNRKNGYSVTLPCKVGDTIWLTGWWDVYKWVSKLSSPIERRIRYFSIESDGVYAHVKDGCINAKYFGEIVFLTKEEAEKALEEV